MSFVKHPLLTVGFVGFTRYTKFTLRKKRIFFNPYHSTFESNGIFLRSSAFTSPKYDSATYTNNLEDILYQKSISQLCLDIRTKGFIIREELTEAWRTLKSSTHFTINQTALLISVCGHSLPLEETSEKLKLLKEIWDSFDDIGIKKTIYHYNAILSVYVELEHNFCPKDFLRTLEKEGLKANQETYKGLIHALSIQGKIDDAQEFLEHMKMHSESVDSGVFNCLILGFSLKGDFLSARGILELMKEKQLYLSSESYINLAMGYARIGDIHKVKEVIEECRNEGTIIPTVELLELAYTFAVNGHSEHFSAILGMIPLQKNFSVISTKMIHRLLHQNLDQEAHMLFGLWNISQANNVARETSRLLLDHYVRFRRPDQVLDYAEMHMEKGWPPISFAYCLKETLLRKDVSHCLQFFEVLKTRNYPLRIHYFYPILIKSQRSFGNERVLQIMQHIKNSGLDFCQHMIQFLHNFYNFFPGAEFEDFEKLQKVGVHNALAAWKILQILLLHGSFTDAIKLVSNYCVACSNIFLPMAMAKSFKEHKGDPKQFVRILYCLVHSLSVDKMNQNSNPEVSSCEYEHFIFEIAQSCSETFIFDVLKEMLEKKMPLSEDAAFAISERFSNPIITAMVSKLRSNHLTFTFDRTLLKILCQSNHTLGENKKFLNEQIKEKYWSELQSAVLNNEDIATIMTIFENLTQNEECPVNKRIQNIVKRTFEFVSEKGDVSNTERIYEVGIQKGLIKADDYGPCFTAHLVSGSLNDALKRFHEGLKATGKSSSLDSLDWELPSKSNSAVDDLMISLQGVQGESFTVTKLIEEFAKLGWVRETANFLRCENLIVKWLFKAQCQNLLRKGHVRFFETLKEASWESGAFSKTALCYPLVRLYALKGELTKLLTLYAELQREDCLDAAFLNVFLDSFRRWKGNVPHQLQYLFRCVKDDCEIIKSSAVRVRCTQDNTLWEHEDFKDFHETHINSSFCTAHSSEFNITYARNILECYCLIRDRKIDEYFQFLRKEIAENNSEVASKYFFGYKLISHMKNPKNLEEYEKLVTMCETPDAWKKYLKLCLRFGSAYSIKRAMINAGPIQHKFFLREISYTDCVRVIKSRECHRQLTSQIAFFYFKVITQCIKQKDLRAAEHYYEEAKIHGLESILNNFNNSPIEI